MDDSAVQDVVTAEDQGSSEEIDEDTEAMLYSLVHYGPYDDVMGQNIMITVDRTPSRCGLPEGFSVTPFVDETQCKEPLQNQNGVLGSVVGNSSQSLNSLKRPETAKCEEFISLSESKINRFADQTSVCKLNKNNDSVLRKMGGDEVKSNSFLKLEPEIIHFGKSEKESSDQHSSKSEFNMEAELGISRCSKGKGQIKSSTAGTRSAKQKMPDLSLSVAGTEFVSSGFISLVSKNHQPKQDYRKTLGRLLTSRAADKARAGKDVVVIQSGSTSSTGSSSDSSDSDSSDESDAESSATSSESDVALLGNSGSDDRSSMKPALDLKWNVNCEDQQFIKRVEERSGKDDDSKWKIDEADMKGSHMSRYYTRKSVRCHNCNKEGHLSKACPEPKKGPSCGLCGEQGHLMAKCKNSLCYNCDHPGHKGANCPMQRRSRYVKCVRCLMKGHLENQCPDLWRQYHRTTTCAEDLVPTKKVVNSRIYCCNCAKEGHFAYECRRERMEKHSLPSYPFIAHYDVAASSSKVEKKGQLQDPETQTRHLKQSHSSHHQSSPKPRSSIETQNTHGFHGPSQGNQQKLQRYYSSPDLSDSTPFRLAQSSRPKHFAIEEAEKQPHKSYSSGHRSRYRRNQSQYAKQFVKDLHVSASDDQYTKGKTKNQPKLSHSDNRFNEGDGTLSQELPHKSHTRERSQVSWHEEDSVPSKRSQLQDPETQTHHLKRSHSSHHQSSPKPQSSVETRNTHGPHGPSQGSRQKLQRYYSSPDLSDFTPFRLAQSSRPKHFAIEEAEKQPHKRFSSGHRSRYRRNQSQYAKQFVKDLHVSASDDQYTKGKTKNQPKLSHSDNRFNEGDGTLSQELPRKSHTRERSQVSWHEEDSVPSKRRKKEENLGKNDHYWQKHNHSSPQASHGKRRHRNRKKQSKNKQKPTPFSEFSKSRESLVVTCAAGFRTTSMTVNFSHKYRNAQH